MPSLEDDEHGYPYLLWGIGTRGTDNAADAAERRLLRCPWLAWLPRQPVFPSH